MTRNRIAAFDGTAALRAQEMPQLVLIEGGKPAAAPRPERSAELSRRQSAALIACGILIVAVLCAASLLTDSLTAAARTQTLASLPEQEVIVQEGDSLWNIACSSGVDGVPIQSVVLWIEERNALSGALLVPGQRLVVPVGGE